MGRADHRKTNQPTKDELDLSKLIYGFLYVVRWICQLSWNPWSRPLEDKPTKQRWIDGAGYDVTSANNKRNHLRRTWSKHMIWRELRRYDNGMHIAHRPISVTTASAAFLQFDWKLLRQFPIMRCMWLLASVVTFQSYSILSGRVAFLQFSWKLPCQFPITVECLTQAASVAISQSYSILSGKGCISSILLKVAMAVSNYERHCSGHQAICQCEQNLQIFIFDVG